MYVRAYIGSTAPNWIFAFFMCFYCQDKVRTEKIKENRRTSIFFSLIYTAALRGNLTRAY